MAFYIVIRGPAGIGKTTISKIIAENINAEYISLDEKLHEDDLDKIKGKCIPEERFLKANEKTIPETINLLKQNKNVVLDGNFYSKSHLEDLIARVNSKHFIFTLKSTLEDCLIRNKTRPNKKDILNDSIIRKIHKLVNKFDFGQNIDTHNKSESEVVDEILHYLKD